MKNKITACFTSICILLLTFSTLFACEVRGVRELCVPEVSINGDTLVWGEVTDAIAYEIDTGSSIERVPYDTFEYTLTESGTYRVRAVGDGSVYNSSAWSDAVSYDANAPKHEHRDTGDDGFCDECGDEIIVIIDIYGINDLHGKFCDTDKQPGVDELATYLKNARENDDYAIFISSGDMWQGSAESNLSGGFILTEWMNSLGFASMTLGNHEFDWGTDRIRENSAIADFPFLAINVYERATNELADFAKGSVIVDYGTVQIGIIGAVGDCYSSIASDMVEDVYFKVGSELTELVKAEAERLEDAGADLIVYSLHDGYDKNESGIKEISTTRLASYYQASLGDCVDIVFEGHTHKSYVLCDTRDTYHLQTGGENRGISHAEISLSMASKSVEVTKAEIVSNYKYSSLEDDPATEELEDKYSDIIDIAYEVLGTINRSLNSSELGDLAARLYAEAGEERWPEYNIALGGGYINTRSPYDLSSGTVRYSDVLSLFPFDNRLTLCAVKGEQLLYKFINNSSYHVYLTEYGNSIKNNIDMNATYYIVVDSYTQLYEPNRLTLIEYYDNNTYARDLIADAIRKKEI